jgi:hypothetical protein
MNGPPYSRHVARAACGVCLVVCSWLATPSPASALSHPAPAALATVATPAPFGDGDSWGWRKLMATTHNRTRVIQIAVVCMCFGLFILMRRTH